jgi:subtilisin family serine protease
MFSRSLSGIHTPTHQSAFRFAPAMIAVLAHLSGSATGAPVQWKNDEVNPQQARLSVQPAQVVFQNASTKNTPTTHGGYVLVRLSETPDQVTRDQLSADGLELLSPVSETTYFARVAEDADSFEIAGRVLDAGEITTTHKLHPKIQSDEMPDWSIVGGNSVLEVSGELGNPTVAAYVMLHRDVDASSVEIDAMVRAHNGSVRSVVMSMNTVVVEMPYKSLKMIASDERVQWVEPPLPPMEVTNASNRVVTQVNTAQSSPYSLDGTGVTVLVYDGGTIRDTHNDFSGRATNIDSAAVHYHATHVAGTIGGDGSVTNNNRGMAPGVNLLGAGFEVSGGLGAGFLYTDPGDLESDYSLALSLGASIANNSIGSNVAQNGYDCNWHGDYGITAGTIDNVVRGSLGDPVIVFWAAGNERGSGRCGTGYGTTAPPSNNKNAISIGALNSNDDSMTSFSSWGPSDDGRLRPVVSAPGCQSGGDNGVTSTGDGSDTQYISLCGTSMASPTAAGVGALILQDFRVQFPAWGDPTNQLMKAILIEGAEDILNTGPDYQSGYGSIRAVDSIEFMRSGNFREESVDQGSSTNYTVMVESGDGPFRLTLVWDDPAGAPNVSPALVNDLDLVVTDPNGTRHYPWTLNPSSPSAGAVRTQEDHINNVEQVFVENPQVGVWQIQVIGTAVTDGPQSFALASALDLGAGLLSLSIAEPAASAVLPGTPIDVTAFVNEGVDSVVPGSVMINYRYASGAFTSAAMNDNGDGSYTGSIPGAECGEFIEYYISASGQSAGVVFSPPSGSANPEHSEVGEIQLVLSDSFQTNNGWTVTGDALDGQWTRGVPVDCSSRGAPGSDSDGSGMCWITDNDAGSSCNSDVDDGTTTLTSPIYYMADGGEFSFDYWYSDIPTGEVNGDAWAVEASTDGGSNWTRLRTSTSTASTWRSDTIVVGDEIGASSTMRFRFIADDVGAQNVIEAGLDNIRITQFVCEDSEGCIADFTDDGSLNFLDVSAFLGAYGALDPIADMDNNGVFNFLDISEYLLQYGAGCP